MGNSPHHKRMQPVRSTPSGTIHYETVPIPVQATLRFTGPPLDYRVEGWVVAWTQQAVHLFWFDHRGRPESGWIEPRDVRRKS